MALRLVKRILRQLAPDELLYVMTAVTSLVTMPAASCRAEVYEIQMLIYDIYRCAQQFARTFWYI